MLPILALAALPCRGQGDGDVVFDLPLDQLRNVKVLTATKTATPLHATPAVITLITADDLARFGYQSVAEALSHVAGLVESDDHLNHNFGVRGISAGPQSASRGIKILLDGQPIAFRTAQQQWTGLEFIPMSMIERIEVVRGPVSVLYGADALLGAINVITRRDGREQRIGIEHGWSGGGRDQDIVSASGSLDAGAHWLAWGVQAARADRAGLALPRISPDYLRYAKSPFALHDMAEPRSLYLRGGWRGEANELTGSVFWQEQHSDNVFASLNPLLRPPSQVALRQGFARADFNHVFTPEHSLRASVSLSQGEPAPGDRVQTGASDYYLVRALGYHAHEASAEWLWQPGPQTSVLAGVDGLQDRETIESVQRHSLVNGSNFQLSAPGERTLHNAGLYLQWQFPVWSGWQAIAGGRRDHHSVYGNQSSLRAGLVGSLPGQWGLKVLGGTAFQAPSAELLYRTAVQPGDIRGNPDLAPQKARTVELQLTTPPQPHWNASLALYHTKVSELVTLEQAFFNLVARNSSDAKVNGAELEMRYQQGAFNAYANASLASGARGTNRYTLAPLAQRPDGELFPRHSANAGISASVPGWPLLLALDTRYVGKRPAATSNVLLANQDYALGSYTDSTFTARWQWSARVQLRLQVRDLWNSRYVDPGVGGIDYPSLGRRYGLHLEWRF
ncbi:MAG: TonB-dependent receptor [Pseudomonadota bacterium]